MNDDAFNQVLDWQSHTMAVSRSQLTHPFIMKLLHQLLPVGTVIHTYDPVKYTIFCPTCKAQEETYDHLLQCSHPSHVGLKSALRTTLLQYTQETHFNHGEIWLSRMITIIWNHCHRLWESRNKDKHGYKLL
jgi:hypothetical protein